MINFKYGNIDQIAIKFGSDKSSLHHGYTKYYDYYFSNICNNVKNVLEIGVFNGSSVKMWEEYFKNATIHGLDINPQCKKIENNRTKIHIGDQSDISFLKNICNEEKYDIIIDDGSHLSEHQIKTFEFLFDYVIDGGIYIIEDTKTSYHKKWTNNESCINFFKKKIDDIGMNGKKDGKNICSNRDRLIKKYNNDLSKYEKEIESIHFYSGLIFIFKQKR
jgi:hypothetical protein